MIVVLGGSGYVGSAFLRMFGERGIEFRNLSRAETDYTNPARLEAALRELRPDFLINCAGYTGKPNVDACEDDKANCLDGNAILPGRIDQVCRQLGLRWGHVSSGCIFTGRRSDGHGFTEEDLPNFHFRSGHCSFYSGTKALGEEILGYGQRLGPTGEPGWFHEGEPHAYIWRLRIPFDHRNNPRNYLTKLICYQRLLEAENSISHLDEFAAACLACFERSVPVGIYNVTNPGAMTTREIVKIIQKRGRQIEEMGGESAFPKDYTFFQNEDVFMKEAARTPRSNCVMDSSKLARHGIILRPVEQAVRESLSQWEGK